MPIFFIALLCLEFNDILGKTPKIFKRYLSTLQILCHFLKKLYLCFTKSINPSRVLFQSLFQMMKGYAKTYKRTNIFSLFDGLYEYTPVIRGFDTSGVMPLPGQSFKQNKHSSLLGQFNPNTTKQL